MALHTLTLYTLCWGHLVNMLYYMHVMYIAFSCLNHNKWS